MGLLKYDPSSRLSTDSGLVSNYCMQFHDPQTEVTASLAVGANPENAEGAFLWEAAGLNRFEVSDNNKLKTQQYRAILHGICNAHAEDPKGPQPHMHV
mmetsp:Transcript_19108/g.38971  ORF Transcript_19108/g.38971 Transcript_19108/m.38971 type:complete len:98 (-) Transcript_19108:810-1103(-)